MHSQLIAGQGVAQYWWNVKLDANILITQK
jgi:hypothetical protein